MPKVDVQPLISDLLQSISVEWIPVDYKHSETGSVDCSIFVSKNFVTALSTVLIDQLCIFHFFLSGDL